MPLLLQQMTSLIKTQESEIETSKGSIQDCDNVLSIVQQFSAGTLDATPDRKLASIRVAQQKLEEMLIQLQSAPGSSV
jgi:hypothetical protein